MVLRSLSKLNPIAQYHKAPPIKKKWVVSAFVSAGSVLGAIALTAAVAALFFATPHLIVGIGGPLLFIAPGALGIGAAAFFIFSVVMRKKGDPKAVVSFALDSSRIRESERIKQYHADLGKTICLLPKFVEGSDLNAEFVSLFTHVHEVLPAVYLGDYRAYLSIDPDFINKYKMVDPIETVFNGPPTKDGNELYACLDAVGCSGKGIQTVISVTRFTPGPEVAQDDWSRFQPKLNELGVERTQIKVDDVNGGWEEIEGHLNEIFEKIDNAIINKKPILIHCVKGASRSASVIYAYLINRTGVTVDQAYNYVKSIRHQAELKPFMKKGLEEYANSLSS